MYRYRVQRFGRDKLTIMFLHEPEDAGFRRALAAVFEPLGYDVSFGESGENLYLDPGPTRPHDGKISVSTDEWRTVWCDADPWGRADDNHRLLAVVDALLLGSGAFERVAGPAADGGVE